MTNIDTALVERARELLVEQVARLIAPSRWRVFDAERQKMLRKYKGQHIGYVAAEFQDKASMDLASEIINLITRALQSTREKKLEEALREIESPIAAMQRRAEAEGAKLDGMMANQIANDPHYLRGIARAALNPNTGASEGEGG